MTVAVPALVTTLTAVVLVLEFPASEISETASTASESATTIPTAMIGPFQLEDIASLVRAAAPQRRHHSCSG